MKETDTNTAPAVRPEAGWEPIEPLRIEGGEGSFVSGTPAGSTLRVAYFRRAEDARLVGRAWFGAGAAGPPGHAHGGAIAAVLDEAMGAAGWLAGYPVVAAHLEVDYRLMVPLGTDAYMEAWVESVDGRKVRLASRLEDEERRLLAEATGLFIILDEERFGDLLRRVTDAQSRTAGASSESSRGS